MQTRITKLTVVSKGKTLFSEDATELYIEDDGGGEFLEIKQNTSEAVKIRFNAEEWPAVRRAINFLMRSIKAHE